MFFVQFETNSMMSLALRRLFIVATLLVLAACQHAPQEANLPTDPLVSGFNQLDQTLRSGDLAAAEQQLDALKLSAAGDTRLESYQRQLAEAYLHQGQQALQTGDLNTATTALGRARSMMPQAPALTTGLDGAIAKARETELSAAQEQRAAGAKADAARLEQAQLLRQAAETQAAVLGVARLAEPPVGSRTPGKPKAQVINPSQAHSLVSMPMLDNQDNDSLRQLLDKAASDVVHFNCAVHIQVRESKDYPWVAALLNARIKRIDPHYKASLSYTIKADSVPRLLLSPQPNL
ncbi:PA5502 family lipoprotein [Pseudomonas sp. EL_65y_Pfl2_R95]|uniref:PA5502 family lipoprotein n=1 Tax=Pseudomonas sp. EL_65y_Pfl2_R95 TaxID=3088698 RepID=UPI0030D8AA4D